MPTWNVWVPYIWTLGIMIFSTGLFIGGASGEPRRTNMGLTYTDPQSHLYHPDWQAAKILGSLGGTIMTLAALMFFVVFFATLFGKRVKQGDAGADCVRAISRRTRSRGANFHAVAGRRGAPARDRLRCTDRANDAQQFPRRARLLAGQSPADHQHTSRDVDYMRIFLPFFYVAFATSALCGHSQRRFAAARTLSSADQLD